MSELPNLRHLMLVAEIARQGGFRRAAETAHLSQPALTQAVRRLERTLDETLFQRGRTGIAPTEAGTLLAGRIDRAIGWLTAGERMLPRHGAPLHRRVTNIQLDVLLALVATGAIGLAATRLGMAQPSVSRALRDLESLGGRSLFHRLPQGMDPTPEARELARCCGLAIAEIRQGLDELRERRGVIDGQLSIGCLPLARTTLLPLAVTRLLDALPEVAVRIVDGPYGELLHALRHGQIDLIIGALRRPDPAADVVQEALFRDPLSIVVRHGHPLLGAPLPEPAALARMGWIVPVEGTPARTQFNGFFAAHGLVPPRRPIECSSLVAVRGLLLRSDRAALLSAAQVACETAAGLLAVLPMALPGTEREIGLTLRADWRPTRAQSRFLSLLREAVAGDPGRP